MLNSSLIAFLGIFSLTNIFTFYRVGQLCCLVAGINICLYPASPHPLSPPFQSPLLSSLLLPRSVSPRPLLSLPSPPSLSPLAPFSLSPHPLLSLSPSPPPPPVTSVRWFVCLLPLSLLMYFSLLLCFVSP